MRRLPDKGVLIGGGLVIGLLLLSAALSYWNIRQLSENAGWVTHTHEVLDLTGEVLRNNVDAETGVRGFVITGQDKFLEPQRAALERLDRLIPALKDKTSDNERQQNRIDRLAKMTADHLALLEHTIALRRQSEQEAQAYVAGGTCKAQMDAIRDLVAEMEQEEHHLLAERERQSDRAYFMAVTTGLVTAVTGLILVGAFIWHIEHHLRAREQLNATLERQVVERTAAVREQEERFRTGFDHASTGMALVALDGRWLRVNRALCALLGCTEEELLATDFRSLTHPEDLAWHQEASGQLLAGTADSYQAEKRYLHKDGHVVHVHVSAALVRDVNGAPRYFITQVQDISLRKKAEEALRTSEERLRLLVEGVKDYALYMLDADGRVVTWNVGAERLNGYRAEEVIGQHFSRFFLPEDAASGRPQQALEVALAKGFYEEERQRRRKDGSAFWAQVTLTPLYDESGRHLGFATITHDITLRKMGEEEMQRAKAAAEDANRAKSEFLANMSHEIRTPMNGVLGMTELLLDTELTAEQRDFTDTIKASAEALLKVINDILDFSKIEAGKLELDPVPFSLRDGLGDLLKPLALRAHSKGLELACAVRSDVPDALHGDLARVQQVLINLVGNAIKFTERGEVVVHVRAEDVSGKDVCLLFSVTDTGPGIPAEKQAKIFTPFEQADGSMTRKYGGTGLGLSISVRLVELLGGRLWLESVLDKGSTFHFTTRLRRQDGSEPGPTAPAAFSLEGVPVLVVDDNASARTILVEMLAQWGMRAVSASDGPAALAALDRARAAGTPFQLVFLDASLPTVNGEQLEELVRQRAGPSFAALILLLSSGERRPQPESARCLFKPIKQSHLLETVQESLAETGGLPLYSDMGSTAAPLPALKEPHLPRTLRILLAEDNRINQQVALRLLENAGHQVVLANTGTEAVSGALRGNFDVVLMDIQMPEMNGLEAAMAIRKGEQGTGRRVPIIALTAHAMKGDRERCLAAGMDGYATKPIRAEQLWQALADCVPAAVPTDHTISGAAS